MIHTYKRKRTSLKSCSFYERVCGDLLVGCSALATPIQDNISNGCYSRETKEAEHKARSEDDLPNNSNILQSLSYDSIKAPPLSSSTPAVTNHYVLVISATMLLQSI